MQGLMSSYPLTLTHVFRRAERIFPEKGDRDRPGDGIVRTTYGEWAERTRRLAGVLDALGISADGRVGTFAWNTARHLELYFAAPCSGPRPAHAEHPPVPGRHRLHRQPRRGRGGLRRPLAAAGLLAAGRPLRDRQARRRDGRRRRRGDPRRPARARLRGAAGGRRAGRLPGIEDENQAAAMCYTSGTTGHPKGVVYSHRSTVLHSMGAWSSTPPAVSERDTIMPVVPMFHANAWGLCQAAVMAGASLVMPGPNMQPKAIAELMESEKVTLAAGVPTIWMGVLPELEGRDSPRCATSSAAARPCRRRCRRPTASRSGCRSCRPGG